MEGRIVAQNKQQLKELIALTIKEKGIFCDLNFIDVSHVTDMSNLFLDDLAPEWQEENGVGELSISMFNGDISKWDVSNATNMSGMFKNARFHKDIGNWNVSNVTNMSSMFSGALFDGDISSWDVSNVTDMSNMFANSKFNGDISNWNVSHVTNMSEMFSCAKFDRDINNWKPSSLADKNWMFENSGIETAGKLPDWYKIVAKDREHLLDLIQKTIIRFGNNCDLNIIDVSNVPNLSYMFADSKFNGDISRWDVSKATNMYAMFCNSEFKGDISKWDVSNVTKMDRMFENSALGRSAQIPGWYKAG